MGSGGSADAGEVHHLEARVAGKLSARVGFGFVFGVEGVAFSLFFVVDLVSGAVERRSWFVGRFRGRGRRRLRFGSLMPRWRVVLGVDFVFVVIVLDSAAPFPKPVVLVGFDAYHENVS